MRIKLFLMVILASVVLAAGCAQSLYMQGRRHLRQGNYQPAIDAFYAEIAANPKNALAWRELGVAYYEKGDLDKADEALKQASSIQPDARTQLYLGLLYEKREDYNRAVSAFTASLNLESSGKTADLTRSHLDALIAKKIQSEVSWAIENESAIDADTIPSRTIAVANFDASHLNPELAPIALGLSELTAVDLAKAHALTVVERQKLDLILQEQKLGTSGFVDPATAPRLGRLMGSRRIVTGSVLSVGDNAIRLDGVIVRTDDSSTSDIEDAQARLEEFFKMQKAFAFSVIDDLGITLTAEERDAISEVPTESYLAFLAFCRGLDYRRRGMTSAAEREFRDALDLDQGFRQADDALDALTLRPPSELDYSSARREFADAVREASNRGVDPTGSESRLGSIAGNGGIIPPPAGRDVVINPPVTTESGTVIVRGDLDAQ